MTLLEDIQNSAIESKSDLETLLAGNPSLIRRMSAAIQF
jgi:hypothetical protein